MAKNIKGGKTDIKSGIYDIKYGKIIFCSFLTLLLGGIFKTKGDILLIKVEFLILKAAKLFLIIFYAFS